MVLNRLSVCKWKLVLNDESGYFFCRYIFKEVPFDARIVGHGFDAGIEFVEINVLAYYLTSSVIAASRTCHQLDVFVGVFCTGFYVSYQVLNVLEPKHSCSLYC